MKDIFHRIDLLRVALQVKGASQVEIEETLLAVRKTCKPASFDSWNRQLAAKELQMMVMMLSPGGEILCDHFLSTFGATCIEHFNITAEEINRFARGRIAGLN